MYEYRALCETVIDGDTLEILIDLGFKIFKRERIRLYGINCPESKSKNLKEKKAGIKAKLFVKHLIEGKYIFIQVIKQEKFGRYLAIVRKAPNSLTSLNIILVEKNFAKKYFGEKRTEYIGNGMIKT